MYGIEQIKEVLDLRDRGWSQRKTAEWLDLSLGFVRKYWRMKLADVVVTPREYPSKLAPYAEELRERFERLGSCGALREEFLAAHPELTVSLRTLERLVKPWRSTVKRRRRSKATA